MAIPHFLRALAENLTTSYHHNRCQVPKRKHVQRLILEQLEDRLAPAVYLVQTTGDDTGLTPSGGSGTEGDPFLIGSLRSAIEQANATSTEDDTILFNGPEEG